MRKSAVHKPNKNKKGVTKQSKVKTERIITRSEINASNFIERLKAQQSPAELEKIQRYFKSGEGEYGEGDVFIGVRMGNLFKLSEAFIEMPPAEIEAS